MTLGRLPRRRTARVWRSGNLVAPLGLLLLALLVAACGGSTTATGSPGASPAETPGSAAPAGTNGNWPPAVVHSLVALGATDAEFKKAGDDLQRGADQQDLATLYGAAGGLAKLADGSIRNAKNLQELELTRDLGEKLTQAFIDMRDGARLLRTAIDNRDPLGIQGGSKQISRGIALYGEQRGRLSELMPEALRQERVLVK